MDFKIELENKTWRRVKKGETMYLSENILKNIPYGTILVIAISRRDTPVTISETILCRVLDGKLDLQESSSMDNINMVTITDWNNYHIFSFIFDV
jgi:hypothetical protein